MPGTKISALTVASTLAAADQFAVAQSGTSKSATASVIRQYVGAGLTSASTATGITPYSSDTYLAGSAITIPTAGGWKVGTQYHCLFDMTKTAAGTATFVITARMGTLGTTGDASISIFTFAAGTAAVDFGLFRVDLQFYAVGSGTTAVIGGSAMCSHHLAATGLVSTGASGTGIVGNISSGFNSTTQTIIGLSVNGGASFAGTNNIVQAFALNI